MLSRLHEDLVSDIEKIQRYIDEIQNRESNVIFDLNSKIEAKSQE